MWTRRPYQGCQRISVPESWKLFSPPDIWSNSASGSRKFSRMFVFREPPKNIGRTFFGVTSWPTQKVPALISALIGVVDLKRIGVGFDFRKRVFLSWPIFPDETWAMDYSTPVLLLDEYDLPLRLGVVATTTLPGTQGYYQLATSQSTRWVRSVLLSICCPLL